MFEYLCLFYVCQTQPIKMKVGPAMRLTLVFPSPRNVHLFSPIDNTGTPIHDE